MCGSTPEVKLPDSSKAAAELGKAKIQERYEDGYVRLEQDNLQEVRKNPSRFLATRGNADLMQTMGRGVPQNIAQLTTQAAATQLARQKLKENSQRMGLDIKDKRRLSAVNIGAGKASRSADILQNVSNLNTQTAVADAQNTNMVRNARMGAIMDAAIGAGKGYMMSDTYHQAEQDRFEKDIDTWNQNGQFGEAPNKADYALPGTDGGSAMNKARWMIGNGYY